MKRYWWHCTSTYHGEVFRAARRIPAHASDAEPAVPRLCVSPSIAECFAAVLFKQDKAVYCYRTESPRRAVMPRNVWDQAITRERWLIPPVKLRLCRTIASVDVNRAQELIHWYHRLTRRNSSLEVRISQLAIASQVIGPDTLRARARRCCNLVNIADPEEYLLTAMDVV
jgi:hypothetical protein